MKNILKRTACLALAMALAAGLAGCGKKDETTADGLMAQISSVDPAAYNACRLEMDMSASQEGMEASLSASMGIEACGKSVHVSDGSVSVGAAGMSFSMDIEVWVDGEAGYTYTNMAMAGMDSGWTKAPIGDGLDNPGGADALSSLWPEGTQFTLAEREKDADYTVTWTVPAQSIQETMGAVPDSGAGSSLGVDGDVLDGLGSCGCTAVFDKDTKAVKAVYAKMFGGEVQDLEIRATDIVLNAEPRALAVPAEVLAAAVEEEDYGWDSGDSWMDTDGGSSFEWTDTYSNDGDGCDETIDGLGERLEADMPEGCTARVAHYSDYAELSLDYSPVSGTGWYGSATVKNVTDDSYGAAAYYADDVGFYESWYEEEPYDKGADYAIFLRDGEMDYVCVIGDMVIDASVYADPGTDYGTMVSYVQELLAMAGVN